jgi:hypothetical protein
VREYLWVSDKAKESKLPSGKPILVTGGPRTGTTWVGRVIAKAHPVYYIHEPFNIGNRKCACGFKAENWFQCISMQNDHIAKTHFSHLCGPSFQRYNLLNLVEEFRLHNAKLTILRNLKNFVISIIKDRRLIKDPLAIFSTEWLASTFKMDVLVMVRHPAAFVNSYKNLNWTHPLSHFLNQPWLIKQYLAPFESQIHEHMANEQDLVDQAAFLWKLIYHTVLKYQRTYPNWIFVQYEYLSSNPVIEFRTIFDRLNLKFSKRISDFVAEITDSQNPVDTKDPYSITRNSTGNVWKWRDQLSTREVERIKIVVSDIANEFYPESSWHSPGEVL